MDQTILNNIPPKPGIYLFKDKKDNILYIGKAKNLKNRVSQYFNPNSVRKQDMLNKADKVDFLQVKTESEALYLEDNLIKRHQPFFNNMLKGSNSYAYIKITKEDFPQIIITRNKIKDGSKYIGPKHNTRELKIFLQYLRYIVRRRGCKKNQFNEAKLCSDYHFGLCSGWCVFKDKISPTSSSKSIKSTNNQNSMNSLLQGQLQKTKSEAKKEYAEIIKIIENFFKGNTKPVEKEIIKQIKLASEKHNFEWAAKLRDIYLQIENLTEKQTVVLPKRVTGYFCQIQEISGRLVYIILNFYEGKIIDVVVNKQNKDDLDENSLKSLLELEFGILKQNKVQDKIIFTSLPIKLSKTQTSEIINLSNGFLDSYLISESFKDDNIINDLLIELQSKYFLKNFPYHIECIDISHFGGSETSGGLSGFLGGIPNYKFYRKYKIDTNINDTASDDYNAIKEVIVRRFKDKDNFPDLFVIDGGKGQLGIIRELMKESRFNTVFEKVDFISIGKGVARKISGKIKGEKEKIFYFDSKLDIKSIDLKYDQSDKILIKLRDESHRFANSYRKSQTKFKN